MRISKILSISIVTALLLFANACEDFLDVNTDPTAPTNVPTNLQLSGLLGTFSYEVIGNEPARTTNRWVQQLSWTGFAPSSDNYDFDESGPDNFWNSSYTVVLNNAREMEQQAEEDGNPAYSGISKIIQAWTFAILTDLWNEIPYSEAFNPANTTPGYDDQEFIYGKIISLLDSALEDLAEQSPAPPGNDDLLYGGDMDKWERLAHTLIARYELRLVNAPGYSAAEQASAALTALQNGFVGNGDDADFQYFNNEGEENPWYQFAIDGKWDTRDQLSAHHINLLQDLNDPRLSIQARPVGAVDNNGLVPGFDPDTTVYTGNVNGVEGGGASNFSSIGTFYSAPDASLTWISYAEAKFIEAEAIYITQGAAAAQTVYEDAIRASMEKLGVDQGDADTYIVSLPLLTSVLDPLEEIITQKYIANFLSLENFNDWRRTGYPKLEPASEPATPSGQIPVRYPYPNSELQNNAGNVSQTGVPVGFESLVINVWWDSGN